VHVRAHSSFAVSVCDRVTMLQWMVALLDICMLLLWNVQQSTFLTISQKFVVLSSLAPDPPSQRRLVR